MYADELLEILEKKVDAARDRCHEAYKLHQLEPKHHSLAVARETATTFNQVTEMFDLILKYFEEAGEIVAS